MRLEFQLSAMYNVDYLIIYIEEQGNNFLGQIMYLDSIT